MNKTTRSKTRDVAFQYRMGAGFPGGVNRSHPASLTPEQMNSTNPIRAYGHVCFADATTNTVRGAVAADGSATARAGYGVLVRPFPFQQSSASNYGAAGLGAATPPAGVQDILRSGFIMATVVGTPAKGNPVYVWCAASTGSHVQGGFEAAASSTDTVQLTNAVFNGAADASGVAEIAFNV